jgi:hypothetical protein
MDSREKFNKKHLAARIAVSVRANQNRDIESQNVSPLPRTLESSNPFLRRLPSEILIADRTHEAGPKQSRGRGKIVQNWHAQPLALCGKIRAKSSLKPEAMNVG